MLAAEIEALAAIGDGADQHGFVGPEVVAGIGFGQFLAMVAQNGDEVEDRGGEVADGAGFPMGHVARHGEGLQVDLRPHDGGTEVEQHAAFEALHGAREDEEIAITGRAERGAVAVGVLVNDVVADAHVHGHRHAGAPGGGENRKLAVRVAARIDAAADVFAEAERFGGGLPNPIVQLAGLAPETEFAGADVAVDAFGGGAEAGQFVIVNGAGAVHGDVIDEAALHQVDDVAVDARAQDMRAHHRSTRSMMWRLTPERRTCAPIMRMRAAPADLAVERRAATAARSGCSNGGVGSLRESQRSRCKSFWRSASGFTSRRERSNCSYRLMVEK